MGVGGAVGKGFVGVLLDLSTLAYSALRSGRGAGDEDEEQTVSSLTVAVAVRVGVAAGEGVGVGVGATSRRASVRTSNCGLPLKRIQSSSISE